MRKNLLESKKLNNVVIIFIILLGIVFVKSTAIAQTTLPQEINGVVGQSVDDGQKTLESLGYEIVYAKSKTQYWYLADQKTCVSLSIVKKKIEKAEVIDNNECSSRLEAARKVWEAYFDGQADVHGDQLDKQREKLKGGGFAATYWIKDVSADKKNSMEYWYNASTNECNYIVFETSSGKFINSDKCESSRCKNPAPKK